MFLTQTRVRRLAVALGASLAVAALLTTAAFSATGLNWKETAKSGTTPVLSFAVTSLTVGKTGWNAHVSFGNLGKKTIKVGNQFGLAFFENSTQTDPTTAAALAPATSFSPARPLTLKPGATWTGVISGTGQLSGSRPSLYARILFGPLTGVTGHTSAIYWITDHWTTLAPSGTGGTAPTGPETVI